VVKLIAVDIWEELGELIIHISGVSIVLNLEIAVS